MVKKPLVLSGLRYALDHPLQTLLLIIGIAVGVAVAVAIDIANTGISRSFKLSTESISGKATHQIVGIRSGIDQSVYTRLRVELGFRDCAPVITGYAQIKELNNKTVRILGIDPFAEANFRNYLGPQSFTGNSQAVSLIISQPNQVLLSTQTAKQQSLSVGDTLTLGLDKAEISVRIAGLLESQNSFSNSALSGLLVTDIATAQEILNMGNQISHIDLILPFGQSSVLENIRTVLPPQVQIVETRKRNDTLRQMSNSFELNLMALSLLALVVGLFLIYNTVTFSVVRRRGLIGIFRALGVTRSEIFFTICTETLVLGFIGTIIGLLLGIGLGMGTVKMVSQSVSDFYFVLTVNQFNVSSLTLIKGFLLGMAASLLSAIIPAYEATRVPPITAISRSDIESRTRGIIPLVTAAGMLLLILGTLLLYLPSKMVLLSFAGLSLIVFGSAFIAPFLTIVITKGLTPLCSIVFDIPGKLAARNIPRTLSRTGVAIASLMVAVSVIVGIGIMIESFRFTVIEWLENTIRADVYIRSPNQIQPVLPRELLEAVQILPEVETTFYIQSHQLNTGKFAHSLVLAMDQDFPKREWIWSIGDEGKMKSLFDQGWVFVSEPFAWKHQIPQKPGETIRLMTKTGMREFKIAGIFSDFSAPQGIIILKTSYYQKYWQNYDISGIALYLKPGLDTGQFISQLEQSFSDRHRLIIVSNKSLREGAISVFDRTFTVTIALQILAALVAFIGILNTIMSLILARVREIGILRAIGISRGQTGTMILVESGLTGFIAGLLSLPLGTAMAWILVFIINKRSFGWTLDFIVNSDHYIQAILIAVFASLLAGIYPAWTAAKLEITEALRTE